RACRTSRQWRRCALSRAREVRERWVSGASPWVPITVSPRRPRSPPRSSSPRRPPPPPTPPPPTPAPPAPRPRAPPPPRPPAPAPPLPPLPPPPPAATPRPGGEPVLLLGATGV